MRRVTRSIVDKFPHLDLNAWYLDDGTVVGPRQELVQLLSLLQGEDVRARGFQLNVGKCEVWWPSGDSTFPEMPPEVQRFQHGIEILKIPVGTSEFITERLRQRVDKMRAVTDRLKLLEDSHVEFTMLRACFVQKCSAFMVVCEMSNWGRLSGRKYYH